MKFVRGKKGHRRVRYTEAEEKFYKQHKKQIIQGLSQYLPKNVIKQTFFSNVTEEIDVNKISKRAAMNKVLRSRTFTTAQQNFIKYQEETFERVFKGIRKQAKSYLGLSQRVKLDPTKFIKTDLGWEYTVGDKTIIFKRKPDTIEGYEVAYV